MTQLKQSNNKKVVVKTKIVNSYFSSLFSSLIQYSIYDKEFEKSFKDLVLKNFKIKDKTVSDTKLNVSIIQMPENRLTAQARALWLVKNKDLMSSEEQTLLYSWAVAGEQSAPQSIVVGFVGVAIPGPTLGLISKKRKVTMIMKQSTLGLKKSELIEKTVALSLDIASQALTQVGGESAKLDPDTSDWFFGERGLKLYMATDREFKKIKKEVNDAKIINSSMEIKGEESILAISPSLNRNYVGMNWKVKTI